MAIPKITFMGIDPPKYGTVTNPSYAKITQADLLVAGVTGTPDGLPNSIAQIEINHDLTIAEATYTGGLAIFGTKDANTTMKVSFSGLEIDGITPLTAVVDSVTITYGQFTYIDSTHWMLMLSEHALAAMGEGTESIKLTSTSTIDGKSLSSTNFVSLDTVSPILAGSSPADGTDDVAVDSNITLTYSETIKFASNTTTPIVKTIILDANGDNDGIDAGESVITLTNGVVTATTVAGSAAANAAVSISGKTITINPTADLANNKTYDVLVSAGLVEDTAGNDAAAVAANAVEFETTHIVPTINVGDDADMNYLGDGDDDGEYGVTLFGDDDGDPVGDQFGTSVSNAGDVNGDGYADIIIGSAYADNPYSSSTGLAYVVFGGKNGLAIDIDDPDFAALNDLDGTNGGFIISSSSNATENLGRSVSSAGDINGDGYADLLVGATGNLAAGSIESGRAFVIYGQKTDFSNVDTSTFQFDQSNGFQLTNSNAVNVNMGFSVSTMGDLNGDGLADFVVGAPGSVLTANPGKAYVVFGDEDGYNDGSIQSLATGTTGFAFSGTQTAITDSALGTSVSDAGDVNGDGYNDLIVSMPFKGNDGVNALSAEGESYVVFGGDSGWATNAADIDAANGTKGFKLVGSAGIPTFVPGDYSGWSVSSAGDINGDGRSDLAVSSTNGLTTYIVFGKAGAAWGDSVDMTALTATEGFTITDGLAGAATGMGNFGFSVSSAGDVNGDGYDDIIIGEPGDINKATQDDASAGATYVIFGKAAGFGAIDLSASALDGSNGFKINGAHAYEHLGNSVSGAGDLNGDGFDDIIVGAAGADVTDQTVNTTGNEGEAYVIYGSEHFGHKVTHMGTAKIDVLTGDATANIFVTGRGNDVAQGKGGADAFNTGFGNDTIKVSDLNFRLVDGGGGTDTLSLAMANKIMTLANENVSNVEVIDITGTGVNTLKITALDVLNMSDNSNKLTVRGNIGDKLDFDDTGWTDAGTFGIYDKYTHGEAVLLVGQSITVVDFA